LKVVMVKAILLGATVARVSSGFSGPSRGRGQVGLCIFKARLLGQQIPVQFGQEMMQSFEVATVFERLLFERRRNFGIWRQALQTFRRPQDLAE